MRKLLSIVAVVFLLVSCKNDKKVGQAGSLKNASTSANDMEASINGLSPLPAETITEMTRTCTSVDLLSLIKEVNVSMNFENPQAVQYVLSFVGDEKGMVVNNCPPQGHVTFISNGGIMNEADIYYNNGCNAMVWMKDQKPIYNSKIASEGIDFFKNFLRPRTQLPQEAQKSN
jgi:hypothetical protein